MEASYQAGSFNNENPPDARRIRWAHEIQPRSVEWVIPDLIPARVVTLVAGPRNVGKSLFTTWLVKRVNELGGHAWINSLEDDLASVVRPRLEVVGAVLERTRVSATPYRFPRDLETFARDVRAHSLQGSLDDLVVLDSLQRHVPKYQAAEPSSETMEGLKQIAEFFGIGVVVVAHFVKAAGATVEQAIGGAGAVQNLAKAIFVIGPEPQSHTAVVAGMLGDEFLPRRVVACERLGIGDLPESRAFEIDAIRFEPTDRAEPFFRLAGFSGTSALDVLHALRRDAAGPSVDESKQTTAAAWIVRTLAEGPMPTRRLEELAQGEGTFFSVNTFERARRLAEVEAIPPADLEGALGADAYSALTDEERRVHWVRSGWSGAALPLKPGDGDLPQPSQGGGVGEREATTDPEPSDG